MCALIIIKKGLLLRAGCEQCTSNWSRTFKTVISLMGMQSPEKVIHTHTHIYYIVGGDDGMGGYGKCYLRHRVSLQMYIGCESGVIVDYFNLATLARTPFNIFEQGVPEVDFFKYLKLELRKI